MCEIKLAKLIVLVLILFSQFSSSSIFVCLFADLLVSPVHRGSVTVSVGNPSFFATDHRHDVRHSSKANISFVVLDVIALKAVRSALISCFWKLYADDGLFRFSS